MFYSASYEFEAAQADVLVEFGPGDEKCRGLIVRLTGFLILFGPVRTLEVLRRALIVFVTDFELSADRLPGLLIYVIRRARIWWPRIRFSSHSDRRPSFALGTDIESRRSHNRNKQGDDKERWFHKLSSHSNSILFDRQCLKLIGFSTSSAYLTVLCVKAQF
jgi:hypothetical protein